MTVPLRTVVLGAGPRGRAHLDALSQLSGLEVTAVWDRNLTTARTASRDDHNVLATDDLHRALVEGRPDLVVVATHPAARLPQIRLALAAGARAVSVEKPIALSTQEWHDIVDLPRSSAVVINQQYPWISHWHHILSGINAGTYGHITDIAATTRASLLDQGSHQLGLLFAIAAAANDVLNEGADALSVETITTSGIATYAGIEVPEDVRIDFHLGNIPGSLTSGPKAPAVPHETTHWFHQQTIIRTDIATLDVTLNQHVTEQRPTGTNIKEARWERDDRAAQLAYYQDLSAAIRADTTHLFPTALTRMREQVELILRAARP